MTNVEIIANFEREINKLDDVANKPATDDSLFWLNQAVAKFIKLRFNGDLIHRTSYEQNDKRRMDLIKLFVETPLEVSLVKHHPSYNEYEVHYPGNFMYSLNEDVIIDSIDGGHPMDTCVFECTADSFMYRVNNSLTDFHYKYHRARPLRIRFDHGCKLLTDKKYTIKSYTLGYLRHPQEITLDNPHQEYSDFEETVMYEIIKMAAQMYIENQKDERYKTISNEVITQE